VPGRGRHLAASWRGPSAKCRACGYSFLLGGAGGRGGVSPTGFRACQCSFLLRVPGVGRGSAPLASAHVDAPFC
jgi:hypothetical protein